MEKTTLKDARIAKGLSMRRAAKAIGCCANMINRWENHGVVPKSNTLARVLEVYGVTFDQVKDSWSPHNSLAGGTETG